MRLKVYPSLVDTIKERLLILGVNQLLQNLYVVIILAFHEAHKIIVSFIVYLIIYVN